jgi:hypothetical protein
MIALIVRTFRIEATPLGGETPSSTAKRLLDARPQLTLTPKRALPLRLVKRDVGDLDWSAAS